MGGSRPWGEGSDGPALRSVLDIFTFVSWLKGGQRERKTVPIRSMALAEHLLNARLGAKSSVHIVSLHGH